MKLAFTAKIIRDGDRLHPVIIDKACFSSYVTQIYSEGDEISISFKKVYSNKMKQQFKFLYSVLYPAFAAFSKYPIATVDGVLKKRFLTVNKGTKQEYVRDKSSLNEVELINYVQQVSKLAEKLDIKRKTKT